MSENTLYINKLLLLLCGMGLLLVACKKPFNPVVAEVNTNVLVVEGVINNGPDSTIIKLSRTVALNSSSTDKPVQNATVTVEDDQNGTTALTPISGGRYAVPTLSLNSTRKYRLRIKTSDGQIYLSDAEDMKNAPPIDTAGYTKTDTSLVVYCSAHDNNNATQYYRWQYEETWRFHSEYMSYYITNGTKIIPRTTSVYNCFSNDASSSIILTSTVKQNKDIVTNQHIVTIPSNSEKISVRYSILVKQYALTQKAYEFWTNLQRNTEQLGTLFDQQPSSPVGNIQCITNPAAPVIGFISVGTVQTKRIFIDKTELPNTWLYVSPYQCETGYYLYVDGRANGDDTVTPWLIPKFSINLPIDAIISNRDTLGYTCAGRYCVDCTLRGGLSTPSFWK